MHRNPTLSWIGWLLGAGLVVGASLVGVHMWRNRRAVPRCPPLAGGSFAGFGYVARGEAPTILLHGRTGSDLFFAQKVARDGFYVRGPVSVDRGGFAWTDVLQSDPDFAEEIDDVGDDLVPFVEAVARCYGKPMLVGHSQGGAVALVLALQRPDLVRRVVVASTSLPRALWRPFTVPVSVIHGTADEVVNGPGVIAMTEATGAVLHRVVDAGHELDGQLLEVFRRVLDEGERG